MSPGAGGVMGLEISESNRPGAPAGLGIPMGGMAGFAIPGIPMVGAGGLGREATPGTGVTPKDLGVRVGAAGDGMAGAPGRLILVEKVKSMRVPGSAFSATAPPP